MVHNWDLVLYLCCDFRSGFVTDGVSAALWCQAMHSVLTIPLMARHTHSMESFAEQRAIESLVLLMDDHTSHESLCVWGCATLSKLFSWPPITQDAVFYGLMGVGNAMAAHPASQVVQKAGCDAIVAAAGATLMTRPSSIASTLVVPPAACPSSATL